MFLHDLFDKGLSVAEMTRSVGDQFVFFSRPISIHILIYLYMRK